MNESAAIAQNGHLCPLQALVLLHDPAFVEAARVLAQRMLPEGERFLWQRAGRRTRA